MKDVIIKQNGGNFLNEDDCQAIEHFNDQYSKTEYKIQTQLLPEPFIGNPNNAKIILLALNPGYSGNNKLELDSEDDLHTTPVFKKLIDDNLKLKEVEYPFYYLNESDDFRKSPGHKFWKKRILRQLIENENISCAHLAKSICCFQYHGYHSTKFKTLGEKAIKSQEIIIEIIQNFIEKNKEEVVIPIVIMRSQKLWTKMIPALESIQNKIIVLKNPRNPVISKNNMKEYQYDTIVSILKS